MPGLAGADGAVVLNLRTSTSQPLIREGPNDCILLRKGGRDLLQVRNSVQEVDQHALEAEAEPV